MNDYEVNVEPNADDEEEHVYVTVIDQDGSVYEGRVYPTTKNQGELLKVKRVPADWVCLLGGQRGGGI